jgi:cell wall assembly regulator SMI1
MHGVALDVAWTWSRMEDWYRRNAPQTLQALGRGAIDEELASLDRALGAPIPDDYRTSLVRHNGGAFIHNADYLDIAWAKRIMVRMRAVLEQGPLPSPEPTKDTGTKVAPVYWCKQWLPVAESRFGTLILLDLAPLPGGMVGQVLQLEQQDSEGPFLTQWSSFAEWLDAYRADLDAGKYEVDEFGNINGPR